MQFERVHYLPILMTTIFPATFVITYCVAVGEDHVSPLFPYISDTGTTTPESCIFGQMLNLSAILVILTCYIRYLQIKDLIENVDTPGLARLQKLNWRSCILGMLIGVGISIVGNFQETNVLMVHLIGALCAFGVGGAYMMTQTYMAFKLHNYLGSERINWLRVILTIGVVIFFFTTLIFAVMFHNKTYDGRTLHMKWTPDQPYWIWHFCSTLSEWLMTISLIIFMVTFVPDFKKITLTTPIVSNKLK